MSAPDESVDPSGVVTVVGVGAGGLDDLPPRLRDQVLAADAVLGGTRHLDMVRDASGASPRTPELVAWPRPLREGLPALLDGLAGRRVVVLASGDPMVSGIGSTLVELLGAARVRVLPAVSSVALARARMGWAAESCAVVSVVGRPVELVVRELAPGRRIIVLSSDRDTPAALAGLLTRLGFGGSRLTVLGNLGGHDETRQAFRADELAPAGVAGSPALPQLNVVAVEAVGPGMLGWAPGLPDDAFEHDGQITKRDVRASALSRLQPRPGEHLWDVGGGSGSIGIEWMRAHPSCRATAVEAHPERAARIVRNAHALGVPGLRVVEGRAPAALAGLDAPDAVFIGGGATVPGVLEACLAALRPGGRLVVHGVTLETEVVLAEAHKAHGGELTRLSVEASAPIGRFTGWTPARTITQWHWQA